MASWQDRVYSYGLDLRPTSTPLCPAGHLTDEIMVEHAHTRVFSNSCSDHRCADDHCAGSDDALVTMVRPGSGSPERTRHRC